MRQGVTAAPHIIKVNLAEAEALLGRKLVTPEDQMAALDALRRWGSDWAVLTLGEQGALFAAGDRRWSARPPKVEAINPIGSGDAMTAGLMAGLVRGLPARGVLPAGHGRGRGEHVDLGCVPVRCRRGRGAAAAD